MSGPGAMVKDGPVVVAHRGLHTLAPENSLEAFVLAWQAGLAWCECDVRLSRDGQLIVIHDDTLDRTTTGSGRVVDYPADELLKLRLRDADGEPRFATLPSLEGVLNAMPATGAMLVELKDPLSPPQCSRLEELLRGHDVVVQSFLPDCLLTLNRVAPSIPLALLIEHKEELQGAQSGPWFAVHADHQILDEHTVRSLRDAGKGVGAWTVTAAADVRRVLRLGVDTLISDDPLSVPGRRQPPARR